MQKSFWEENVSYWKRSVGLWCCLMLGVVTLANSKAPHADQIGATASVAGPVTLLSAHASAGEVNSNVTLSYTTLDVTTLNASAYGDIEF